MREKTLLKESDFIFDLVQLTYYKCHRVNFICGASYIGSPDWTKKKKKQQKIPKKQMISVFNTQQLLH